MPSIHYWTRHMPTIDKLFYQQLGQRIAFFRKEADLTQSQLAELLGISQQTMAHYEVGRLRISVELLSKLAQTLTIGIEQLLQEPVPNQTTKRGPTSLLQKQIEQVSQLPRAKQKFVSEMLDAVIQQNS
ncbi:helix-turn-helix domain-containing protein [Catenovulum sediminis]|uniref:helix-turn-helix domain-containing protein n=1 Tax=Catenovulum sediminis TaxID=1740262 RepID=UPI00117C3E36|nr:helix-turn-helix transcriptional regulator [Catenovulum sediminis]